MMPLALDLISTLVTGSILPVATTERARSMRSAFTSFSGSILGELRPMALRANSAAPPSRGTRRNKIHLSDRFLREVAISMPKEDKVDGQTLNDAARPF